MNGDGVLDLALANTLDDDFSLLLGNGDGSFGNRQDYYLGNAPYSIAIDDLNIDGTPDVAVANEGSNDVSIFLGRGDGTYWTCANYPCGTEPWAAMASDFNADGAPDLVVTNVADDNVSVFPGNGDGTFAGATSYGTGDKPRSVTVSDLDGDGELDIVTANEHSGDVSVMLGTGGGAFASSTGYPAGLIPTFVVACDLNGDLTPDLAVADGAGNAVSVLLGNGDGSFAAHEDYDVGFGPIWIAAADLNGDGALDLVSANCSHGTVSVLLGSGDGSFAPRTDVDVGSYPCSVAIEDLNGDGALDLAVANVNDHDFSVLLGNGDGSFASRTDFDVGHMPYQVTIVDLDGDGVLDVVVPRGAARSVSFFRGIGDGSFATRHDYGTRDRPFSVAVADFDGNSRLDVASVNNATDDFSVLLNTLSPGEPPDFPPAAPTGLAANSGPDDGQISVTWNANGEPDFHHYKLQHSLSPSFSSATTFITSSTSRLDSGLAPGTTYYYRLYAVDDGWNQSTPSGTVSAVAQDSGSGSVAAPTGVVATPGAGEGEILVSWNTNSEPDLDHYRVERDDAPTFGASTVTFDTPSTSYQDSGLILGQTYYYRVIAVTTSGESDPSASVSADALDLAPAVPTGLAAVSGPGDGQISVSWNANGESDFDYYRLQRGTNPTFSGGYSTFITSATSRLDSGLTPGETYYYRVYAVDDGSNQSDTSTTVSAEAYSGGSGTIAVPTGVAATPGSGEGEILVSWNANSEPDLDHYRVERDDAPTFGAGTVSFDTAATSYQDSELTSGQTYYYRVIAVTTSSESDPSATVSADALDLAPAVPTGLAAVSGPGDGQISVSWNANGESDFDYYRLQRGTNPTFSGGYSTFITSATSRLDSGLTPGETYYYRVYAVDDGSNQSDTSTTVSAEAYSGGSGTIAVPTGVAATPGSGEGEILVSWNANSEPDLDHYRVERDDAPTFGASTVTFDTPSTSYQDSGLTPGQTYYYRVVAVTTSSESDPSASVSADGLDLVPSVPTGLAANPGQDEGQIQVSWNANGESDFDYYRLQRGTNPTFSGGYSTFITSATSRLDSGLVPGSTYYYRVSAVDDGSNQSDPSGTVSAEAQDGESSTVAAPTGVAATPGSGEGEIQVIWNANSEPDLDHYRVERDDAPVFGGSTVSFDTPSTCFLDSVAPGQTYYYRVIAVTTSSESDPSESVSVSTPDLVPAVPTGLAASPGSGEGEILVTWDASGEPDLDHYVLERCSTANFGGNTVSFNTPAPYFVDAGLTPGNTYYYRVYAVDAAANKSSTSNSVSAEAQTLGAVAAPTGVTAAPGSGEGEILVSWNANSEPDLDHYRVERDDAPVFGAGTVSFDTSSTSYQDSGLTPGQTYYYRVIAVTTSSESDPSAAVAADALNLAPATPTGLVANAGLGEGEILVSWDANSEIDLDYYRLERSTSSSFLSGRVDVDTAATSHEDTGLTPGQTYYYRVVAVDTGADESAASLTASAATLDLAPAAPMNLAAASGPGQGEATVMWDANAEPDIDRYHLERDICEDFNPFPESFTVYGTSYVDTGLGYGETYYYRVFAVDAEGNQSEASETFEITLGDTGGPEPEHREASISLAGPNPSYTGEAAFAFGVPQEGANVSIALYDISGRLVRSVIDRYYGGGVYEATWDGKTRSGQQVGSGVYLCLARIGDWTGRTKVVLAR